MLALAQAAAPSSNNHAKAQFMQAMNDASSQKQQKEKQRQLYKKIIDKAVPVDSSRPTFLRQSRQLDGQYYNDDAENYGDFGFDVSSYSLKYAGCSAISTFSDAMAEANDGVSSIFSSMSYVVFRLCPTETCSPSSVYGCSSDYGEYMVPMGDWLDIISAYREEEFERYCQFCANCMANEGNNRRRLDDGEAAAEEEEEEAAEDEEEEHACQYYNACSTYQSVCNQRRLDNAVDVSEYFECTKVEYNGNNYYAAPHCSSDKHTISIGLFKDQYCTQLISQSKANAYNSLGFDGSAMMNFYKTDCIACKESDLPYQEVDEDAEDNNDVTEMCENLYTAAAKCNRHIGSASSESYQSSEQEDNSQTVCNYIGSVVSGRYDEDGFIYVDSGNYRSSNSGNKYHNVETIPEVSVGQVFGILILSIAFIWLWLWSCCLRAAVSNISLNGPNKDGADGSQYFSRTNSGIMMGRSRTFDNLT